MVGVTINRNLSILIWMVRRHSGDVLASLLGHAFFTSTFTAASFEWGISRFIETNLQYLTRVIYSTRPPDPVPMV